MSNEDREREREGRAARELSQREKDDEEEKDGDREGGIEGVARQFVARQREMERRRRAVGARVSGEWGGESDQPPGQNAKKQPCAPPPSPDPRADRYASSIAGSKPSYASIAGRGKRA